ncbi:MAG TPA: histidine kinase [Streptosporangiaceae bacterium]
MSSLYAWLRRHPRMVDGVLAAVLAVGGLAEGITFHRYVMIPVTLGLTIPVVFRRAHPTGAFAIAIGVGAIQLAASIRPGPPDFAIVVLLYTLAAYTTRRTSVTGLAVCLLGSAAEVMSLDLMAPTVRRDWWMIGSIIFAGPSLIAWVLGDSMRYRRAYYANLEERAARLERDRDAQAQIAAAAERARIARELHDVVAHNVSVMVVQADGAAYALDASPERARDALAAISATGRQALTEMRVLLGVLRRNQDDDAAELAPLPGLGQLDELLDQARAAGLAVTCTVHGDPQPLPGGAALAAYRIIQESLTNARKHAGGWAHAEVVLRYGADAVEITVTDDGAGVAAASDGAGHGLTGMRERAALYGGSVRAGPLPGGGFEVQARLPVAAGVSRRSVATPAPAPDAAPARDPAPDPAPDPALLAPPAYAAGAISTDSGIAASAADAAAAGAA